MPADPLQRDDASPPEDRDPGCSSHPDEWRLLTVDEVAERLQVPRTWVYKRAAAGKIPCLKIGRYVRFNSAELHRWLMAQRHDAP
jgi:excisionase family DNA binding protein